MGTTFTIRDSVHDGVARVLVAGDVDLGVVQHIRDTVTRLVDSEACRSVILDLSGVTFIDSSGLGVLVTSKRQADEAGKTLTVAGAQGRTAYIIELTGLTAHLTEPGSPNP